MNDFDLQQAIDKLRSSPHYKKLAAYEPPFNPFEIAGVTHRELTHSSVLAWLLRDEANKEFRQSFVSWIRDRVRGVRDRTVAEAKKTNDDCDWDKFVVPRNPEDSSLKPKIVKTEEGDKTSRVDVFAHFESLKLIISIEVKVWAGEQDAQVKRYQDLLCKDYPGYKKLVVFLTPTGWEPETADEYNVDVPVLTMSWSCISKIIREMRRDSGRSADRFRVHTDSFHIHADSFHVHTDGFPTHADRFRMQFLQHLEKHLTTNETEGQRIVRELLSEGDNLKIIKKVTSKMETWDDKKAIEGKIDKDMVQKIVNNRYSLQTSLECEFWRELKKQFEDEYEKSEFQLYQSDSLTEVIEDGKLDEKVKEYIKWGYGGSSPGLTFRIPDGSLDKDHEVVCRITYDTAPISHLYYGFVLCKKGNMGERVEIKDDYHKKCLDLLGGEILDRGPDKKHGWLRWKLRTDVNIYFANKPALFDTLVDIKECKDNKDKENVVKKLAEEIRGVVNKISEETRDRRIALTPEKSDGGQDSS